MGVLLISWDVNYVDASIFSLSRKINFSSTILICGRGQTTDTKKWTTTNSYNFKLFNRRVILKIWLHMLLFSWCTLTRYGLMLLKNYLRLIREPWKFMNSVWNYLQYYKWSILCCSLRPLHSSLSLKWSVWPILVPK